LAVKYNSKGSGAAEKHFFNFSISPFGERIVDAGYRLLAAKFLRKQAKQLREQLQGIRDGEDIEFIHRARVATRRLREALKVFAPCFRRKPLARWSSAIRRITKKLGKARDKDIQIELLRGLLPAAPRPECLPGLSRLLAHWECSREALQKKVLKTVRRLQAGGELDRLEKKAKQILRRSEKKSVRIPSPYCFAQSEENIARRREALIAFSDCLQQPENVDRHHAMRIAVKRLRYTMEIFRPLYDKRLDPFLDKVKRLQTLLGDLHDCDVWQEQLDDFIAGEHQRLTACFGHARPFVRLQPGVDFVRENRRQRREELFGDLGAFWRELENQDCWTGLHGVVRIGPIAVQAVEPPAPAEIESVSAIAPVPESSSIPEPPSPLLRGNGDQPHKISSAHTPPEPTASKLASVPPHSHRREPAML
jgi:CHAD domain-containing protein